jgi:hypothetical protein
VAYANYFNKKLYGGVYCKKATVFDYKVQKVTITIEQKKR